MEPLELTYTVDARQYQRALTGYLWKKTGGYLVGGGCALLLAAAVARSEPWLSGFVTGAAVALLARLLRLLSSAKAAARARDKTPVQLRIGETDFEFDSDWGLRRLPWRRLRAVRTVGEFVELDLGRAEPPVWVPLAVVEGAPLAALERGARQGGSVGATG